jgi:hypothetical protein
VLDNLPDPDYAEANEPNFPFCKPPEEPIREVENTEVDDEKASLLFEAEKELSSSTNSDKQKNKVINPQHQVPAS